MTYMQLFAMISQFILGLTFIVGIHELGHLLFAKLFGIRVDSYMIGFPPKIFTFKWGETEYGLGALPLGGSVKLAGMVDESLDTAPLQEVAQAWEFRAKKPWQRLIVILGGIICNMLAGILIYANVAFWAGDTFLAKDEVNKYGVVPNELGIKLGFQEGDKILAINGKSFYRFSDILAPWLLLQEHAYYTVERAGEEIRIEVLPDLLTRLAADKQKSNFIAPRLPFLIGEIQAGSGAEQAGLQVGDKIVAIAGQKIAYFHQLRAVLAAHANAQVEIQYSRKGNLYNTLAQLDQHGKLGFCPQILLQYEKENYSLGKSLVIGTKRAFEILKTNILGLKQLITGKIAVSKSLSGPIGIAQIFGRHFDWMNFWSITGFLCMVLAFTNLLPIPALDGGHALWIIFEILSGRPLSEKFLEKIQKIGLIILLILIGYATINDLLKLF